MPQTNEPTSTILVAGDSTVDWFIAEPARPGEEQLEARYVWSMRGGPGISSIAGGASLDTAVLQATSALSAKSTRS